MPDDVAIEKVNILQTLGAEVVRVRPGERQMLLHESPLISYIDTIIASIVDEKQFVVSAWTSRAEWKLADRQRL